MPDFERNHAPLPIRQIEFKTAVEVVRCLLIVVEHEVAAHGADLIGECHAHSPSRHVYLMHALIAQVAISIGPIPVPVVVETVLGERPDRGRSHPKVVMDAGGNRLHSRMAYGVSPFKAEPARYIGIADNAVL